MRNEPHPPDSACARLAPPVQDAAAVILVRRRGGVPEVLMGQRGARAVFMPSKFVFPGGALEPDDLTLGPALALEPESARRLELMAEPAVARGLVATAIRELWEETGLALGRAEQAARELALRASPTLRSMLEHGIVPDPAGMRFVFRAVTPPGRPRRFDARFFLVEADRLATDPDDFSRASGELARLQWLDLAAARALELPFITELVLGEVETRLAAGEVSRAVPFFHAGSAGSHVLLD